MAFDLGGGKKRGPSPSMNVTPLVDVVLVLLIIFMVVTPLLTKQMWMTVPAKSDKPEEQPPPPPDALPPVVLTVDRAGVLRINRDEVPRDQVVARLQRMLNARPDKIVFFDAGDDVPYGAAMEVLDLARGGNLTVGVLPDKLAD
ncbi:ExbD/TolR family TonB system transport protein [Myxococcus stipitatus DSM 14675]|uniref:ExbD/TolR family TonB system transport protein n=1 Tax=Myxococcus stipitatus (strain DSM 14675 / JCM 12634 / Mx s8) TaxID=1278073 RepID=L7U057_MYXSD|nr:biopolymer transporter ExbD [Myxococcus stipitatus]AGC41628.1 ExbD/TolR family TonB system transport protein [Myxococcus stipitatus DSM 14675]